MFGWLFNLLRAGALAQSIIKAVEAARGLVLDTALGRVLCNPMPKFFNLNETEKTKLKNLSAWKNWTAP